MAGGKRADRWLLALGVLGLILYFVFSWRDLLPGEVEEISREQAVAAAQANWAEQGVKVEGLDVNAILESDAADAYLGREGLREEFALAAPEQAPLAYWHVTFYEKGLESNTYESLVNTETGKVIGYTYHGELTGESDEHSALTRAQEALKKLGVDIDKLEMTVLDDLRPLDELEGDFEGIGQDEEPVDVSYYFFSWQATDFKVGKLNLYYDVTVEGDRVTKVGASYELPETFTTWHERQTLVASLLTGLSLLLTFVMFIFGFVFLFLLKQPKPYWSTLWLTVIVFVTFGLSNLNSWPIIEQEMLSETGMGAIGVMLGAIAMIVMVIMISTFVAAATYPMILTGGMLVQEIKPSLWTSRKSPLWAGNLKKAVWRGYLLAFAWLGFQGLFYWVSETFFGVWYENDMSMSPTSMWLPALFPLMAWMAGIHEELVYRLFGVTFLKRYLKSSFIAVLLPAMVWALGHALYPVYPIYTRFIELTIFGVIIGYCYLALGIETVIFAHVIFDTILMSIPLLLSGEPLLMTSAVFFLILPVLVGYGISLMKRKEPKVDFA